MVTLQTVYPFRTANYANLIYIYGSQRLTARDGYTGISSDYYIPVEKYAITNYQQWQIDNALEMGYISQQEYDETMSYKTV